mmetsp:Transcript_2689/g.5491  ORF Transcript_2689/g.5491 Transcript_2689/m.5491 type:complete len:87 (+) Transcript_2689:1693-1953(+)
MGSGDRLEHAHKSSFPRAHGTGWALVHRDERTSGGRILLLTNENDAISDAAYAMLSYAMLSYCVLTNRYCSFVVWLMDGWMDGLIN